MDHIMNDDTIHNNLVTWITKNGGTIHRNLALYTPQIRSSGDDIDTKKKNYSHRGIFAKQGRISKGEILIRLPSTLALDGSKLPTSYATSTCDKNDLQLKSTNDDASLKRNASPWLRCMAQLINAYDNQQKKQHDNEQNYNSYLESLPKDYDSLLNWSTIEIKSFLKGTALCTSSTTNSSSSDDYTNAKDDENDKALHERFVKTVVPYLSFLRDNGHILEKRDSKQPSKRQKIEEESSTDNEIEHLYPLFREGCMCISTRAFHMQSATTNNKECYQGPFLLPYIDLLNHASQGSSKHVTTLSRDTDGSFIMIAERDIEINKEICHSYDSGSQTQSTEEQSSSLNSAQLLQTFGFNDAENVSKRLLDYHQQQDSDSDESADSSLLDNITPVVLTKKDISKACTQLASSSYPDTIRTFMNQSGMIDEGWECWGIPPMNDSRSNLLALYSDEILVPFRGAISDELISICWYISYLMKY